MKLFYITLFTTFVFSYSLSNRIELDDSVDFVTALSTFQNINKPYASPTCWLSGIQKIENFIRNGSVLQQEYSPFLSYSGASFCSTMTEQIRQVLAFHTTQCYASRQGNRNFAAIKVAINDGNEHLTVGEVTFENENQSLEEVSESINKILGNLNDIQFNLYTSFYQHIDHICMQLSREMWNNQIELATNNLMKSVKDLPGEFNSAMQVIEDYHSEANQKRMEVLQNFFSANSEKLEQQLSSLNEQHMENQEKLYSAIDKISIPINKIAEGMNELTPTNTILQFLAVLNAMWLITSFSWMSSGRPYITLISFLELFAEITLHWIAIQGHIMVTFKEFLIPKIRMVALGLDLLVIFLSICFYLFRSKPADISYNMNDNYPRYQMNSVDNRYIPIQNMKNTNTYSVKSPRCYDDDTANRSPRRYNDNVPPTSNHQSASNALRTDECIENLFNTFSNLQRRTEQKLPFQSPNFKRRRNTQLNSNNYVETSESMESEPIREDENMHFVDELIAAKSNLINLLEYVDTIEQERIRSPKRSFVEATKSEDEEEHEGKKKRLSL